MYRAEATVLRYSLRVKNQPAARIAAWEPLARALCAYHDGRLEAMITVRASLWEEEEEPAASYYRPLDQPLPAIERIALDACRGRVLDIGAGAGRHALELQGTAHEVVAIDPVPEIVAIMEQRGVRDARCESWQEVSGRPFDTVLLMMHGIGVVGTLDGLGEFLLEMNDVLSAEGHLLFDSADLVETFAAEGAGPEVIEQHPDRYLGEVEFELGFEGEFGEPYPWLFVDPQTLAALAEESGFATEVIAHGTRGTYLARLNRRDGP